MIDDQTSHSRSKWKAVIWLVLVSLVAFLFADCVPYLAKKIPMRYEKRVAEILGDPLQNRRRCYSSKPNINEALQKFQKRIYPLNSSDEEIPIEINFIKSDEVNAFAYLGGEVYINSKLLNGVDSPEELAGDLAHEIAHIQQRHIIQGVFGELILRVCINWLLGSDSSSQIISRILQMKFTSVQEAEADRGALARLNEAHISAKGMQTFFERLEKEDIGGSFLSDHPSNRDRARWASLSQLNGSEPVLSKEEWSAVKEICSGERP
jgi:predicted Zn-dependent protease